MLRSRRPSLFLTSLSSGLFDEEVSLLRAIHVLGATAVVNEETPRKALEEESDATTRQILALLRYDEKITVNSSQQGLFKV